MKKILFYSIAIILLVFAIDKLAEFNETDNAADGIRSGLSLYIDHGTGCQYISRAYLPGLFSGLIPRVDGEGHHMGCKK